MTAARLAFMLVPMEEMSAVTQVPILVPSTTNMTEFALSPMIMPAAAMEMRMEVTAEEL